MLDVLKACIKKTYHLKRDARDWLLEENGKTIKLRSPGNKSLGFSLDHKESSPFQFFGESPPKGVAKMCDAIIMLSHNNRNYVFVVEKKTAHRDGYAKQIANGRHFCNWLFALLQEHGHYNGDLSYIGLLVWESRRSPDKEPTSHRRDRIDSSIPPALANHLDHFAKIRNKTDIRLQAYLND